MQHWCSTQRSYCFFYRESWHHSRRVTYTAWWGPHQAPKCSFFPLLGNGNAAGCSSAETSSESNLNREKSRESELERVRMNNLTQATKAICCNRVGKKKSDATFGKNRQADSEVNKISWITLRGVWPGTWIVIKKRKWMMSTLCTHTRTHAYTHSHKDQAASSGLSNGERTDLQQKTFRPERRATLDWVPGSSPYVPSLCPQCLSDHWQLACPAVWQKLKGKV